MLAENTYIKELALPLAFLAQNSFSLDFLPYCPSKLLI
jgi:hypothetical protein